VSAFAAEAPLLAPFPWFGGKSRAADLVWSRFGDVANYVEPFAGSLAVLLMRPEPRGYETVNDRNAYVANFWRSIRSDPAAVAEYADSPVNETDLRARHAWLAKQSDFRRRMEADPEYFDARIAGWWVWGISQWIGSGWCSRPEWQGRAGGHRYARGVQTERIGSDLVGYFAALADRLRGVRVCCGDWARILKPSATSVIGHTAVLLDPPYAADRDEVYSDDSMFLAHEVREWAIHTGDDPRFRIALCGYEGEHEMPASWECCSWKAHGGYGNAGNGRGRLNAERERIWFSPACIRGGDV
jgi:hypothetical protein